MCSAFFFKNQTLYTSLKQRGAFIFHYVIIQSHLREMLTVVFTKAIATQSVSKNGHHGGKRLFCPLHLFTGQLYLSS
jgi:hypothetical protein